MADIKKIMIVAGEASGDLHGSELIKEYKKIDDSVHFYGIGSSKMKAVGMEALYDSKDIAVVGILEVLTHFKSIKNALNGLKTRLKEDKPDLLVLIDFPDFNLRLAAYAKKIGVKVLYYISPQVWAWRKNRVKKMAKVIDKIAVVFPFEEQIYKDEGVDVAFVGHPLLDCVKTTVSKEEYRKEFGVTDDKRVIMIMPGSRVKEIERLLDEMLGAAKILKERDDSYYLLVSCAPTVEPDTIRSAFDKYGLDGKVVTDNMYDAINASDFVITKSGTSTLEVAILGVPMVIVYKVSALTYFIGKNIFNIDTSRIGLANIVAGENVVQELIQGDACAKKIADSVLNVIDDRYLYDQVWAKLTKVKERLGKGGASKNVAALIKEFWSDEKYLR